MAEQRRPVKRLLQRLWSAIDAETVVLFQIVFGVVFIAAGLYGIFIADRRPPMTLQGSMAGLTVDIWYWLNVIGPLICLLGKSLHGNFTYAGMWLQLTGDATFTTALLAYIAGTVQVESWGHGAYGAFLGAALCICAALMVTRDVRRLRSVERQIR